MENTLLQKKCVPCEGGIPPATDEEISHLMPQVPGWQVVDQDINGAVMNTLQRRFEFEDFRSAMSFLRQVEDLAEAEGHHPNFCVDYNKVDFTLWTHAIRGLHENDFILAAKITALTQ